MHDDLGRQAPSFATADPPRDCHHKDYKSPTRHGVAAFTVIMSHCRNISAVPDLEQQLRLHAPRCLGQYRNHRAWRIERFHY
jgi:hypothetical protein